MSLGKIRVQIEGSLRRQSDLLEALIGFLIGFVVLRLIPRSGPPKPSTTIGDAEKSGATPIFTDVTDQVGLRFRHETGQTGRYERGNSGEA